MGPSCPVEDTMTLLSMTFGSCEGIQGKGGTASATTHSLSAPGTHSTAPPPSRTGGLTMHICVSWLSETSVQLVTAPATYLEGGRGQ